MAHIVFENVTKHYATEKALDGIDLDLMPNATTAIVGPSGSGKSTLLQLINGLERPTTGRVSVLDADIDYERLPELRRQIGYAVQGVGLFPHMTVWENITLLARLSEWESKKVRERAEALMSLVGLPARLEGRYPFELSGGQQQRVGLCRAMMLNPPIFLLDEPFGAVDPITRGEIHDKFLKLQRSEARTIVLVTHDIREALRLAERIVVLDRGRVVQNDTGDEILRSPANDFVRDLFSSQLESWRLRD